MVPMELACHFTVRNHGGLQEVDEARLGRIMRIGSQASLILCAFRD